MDSLTELHLAVGNAITGWSHLEEEMCEALCAMIHCDIDHAGIIMFTPNSFATKLEMIDSVFHHDHSEKPFEPFWTDLIAYIRYLSGKRNSIAHRAPIIYRRKGGPEPLGPFDLETGVHWGLAPHELDSTRKSNAQRRKKFLYKPEDIQFAGAEFSRATHLLRQLRFETDEFSSSDGIWPQLVDRPTTIHDLERLPYRIRLDQPQS